MVRLHERLYEQLYGRLLEQLIGFDSLYEGSHHLIARLREQVDDRYLGQGVASRSQSEGGAGHTDQDLRRERRVVDAHIEGHTLVGRLAAGALAGEVYAVAHIAHVVHRLHGEDVELVVGKVVVSLEFRLDLRHGVASPRGMVMESAFLTPFLERATTLWPIDIPGPKLV